MEVLRGFVRINSEFGVEYRYLFPDEISGVKDWQRGIKYLYETGRLKNSTAIMPGSHVLDIHRAAERLPGRRGVRAGSVDKVLLPLKFAEYLES